MNYLETLDRLFDGLKFKEAIYVEKTNTCSVNFLYNPDVFKPNIDAKSIIMDKLKEIVGDYVKYDIIFNSCPLDKRTIANHIYSTIINNFPALSKNFTYDDVKVEIEGLNVKATLNLAPSSFEYATSLNREELVANKLKTSFLADFEVVFTKKNDIISQESAIDSNAELLASIKEAEEKTVYELSGVANIIGNTDYTIAIDYKTVTTPIENVIICGEVTSVEIANYARKVTKDGETKEIERHFLKYTIKNDNKIMYCSLFVKPTEEAKLSMIEVGMKICSLGSFKEFNKKLSFTSQTIARCEYVREEIKSKYKQVNEEYHTVFPQEYIDYEQSGLFDDVGGPMPGNYVVFDLETTGLDGNKDEIIEIGACKIVNGQIEEVFSTFVKPNKHIPKEITELTGIDDDMVKDAPTINYVLPDFYKFCYGAPMVGHNVSFDISFIYTAGKKLSYNFDNKLIDTLEMSKTKLPGLKNYKLGTVVDKLNIVLENAHRAVNDATATAKVFIKLMKNY